MALVDEEALVELVLKQNQKGEAIRNTGTDTKCFLYSATEVQLLPGSLIGGLIEGGAEAGSA